MKCFLNFSFFAVHLPSLRVALLLCFIVTSSGCASQETLEKIRENTEQSAMADKGTFDILGKANKDIEGVPEIVAALNKNFSNIPKPVPFEIPDWLIILGCTIAGFLFPDFAKKAGQGAMGSIKIIKKVIGKK